MTYFVSAADIVSWGPQVHRAAWLGGRGSTGSRGLGLAWPGCAAASHGAVALAGAGGGGGGGSICFWQGGGGWQMHFPPFFFASQGFFCLRLLPFFWLFFLHLSCLQFLFILAIHGQICVACTI